MPELLKTSDQTEKSIVLSAITEVLAEASQLADSKERHDYDDQWYLTVKKLCDAVAVLRATGWRSYRAEEMRRRQNEKD